MHYIIDGYNLLFRMEQQESIPLKEARRVLLDTLCEYVSLLRLEIIIVFDAKTDCNLTRGHLGSLEVVYTTAGVSADDYILDWLSHQSNPKQFSAVTSDKPLARQCRALGAKTIEVGVFINNLKRWAERRKNFRNSPSSKKSIQPPKAQKSPSVDSHYLNLFEKRYKELSDKERALQEEKRKKRKKKGVNK